MNTPNSKLQTPNSKLQTPNSKLQTPNSKLQIIFSAFLLLNIKTGLADWGDSTISNNGITIKTCARDAGAICSLVWHNREFIDDVDKGRQLQSSVISNTLGLSFNPTEAGAEQQYNGLNWNNYTYHNVYFNGQPIGFYTGNLVNNSPASSSSQLQGIYANGNTLSTQTKMAFWFPVGGRNTSNHILNKNVIIGLGGNFTNVIKYSTQFTIPIEEKYPNGGAIEPVTAYMPSIFSKFWAFNPFAAPQFSQIQPVPGNGYNGGSPAQRCPLIFSTADGLHAMGVISRRNPAVNGYNGQIQTPGYSIYGRFKFSDTTKWNTHYALPSNAYGVYHLETYIFIGTLEQVKTTMLAGYNAFPSDTFFEPNITALQCG